MDEGVIAFIGFGEAGQAFAPGMPGRLSAYDRKTDDAATAAAKMADYRRARVAGATGNAAAIADAPVVLSLVTAGQALAAARETAAGIAPGALYCDLNSVAPDTKRVAATLIEAAGGRYVDGAIMAPVEPAGREVPLLLAGPHAEAALAALAGAGFTACAIAGPRVGDAAAVKMIRSVITKGVEALTAECALAAAAAGVLPQVLASLDASWPGADWAQRFDYNLDRMLVHGERRAAELDEVVATLAALGTGSALSRAAAARQRRLGAIDADPPQGLAAKLALIAEGEGRRAAA